MIYPGNSPASRRADHLGGRGALLGNIVVICSASIAIGAGLVFAPTLTLALLAVASIVALLLFRFDYGVACLIVITPFYFLIKAAVPGVLQSVWWDLLVVGLVVAWILRVSVDRPASRFGPVMWLGAFYLLWGTIAVFTGSSVRFGIYGFRDVFLPVLLLPVIAERGKRPGVAWLYLRAAILAAGLVAMDNLLQFALVNGHLIGLGSALDSGRAQYMHAHGGFPPTARFGLQRALGPWPDPSQSADFIAGAMALVAPFAVRRVNPRPRKARWMLGFLTLGLATTISTWPLLVMGGVLILTLLAASEATARVDRAATLGVLVALAASLWLTAGRPAPADNSAQQAHNYSTQTVLANTSHLQYAFSHVELMGGGLFAVPAAAAQSPPVVPGSIAQLGTGFFFLDDLVSQIGLVGVALLLAIWLTSIRRAYRASRAGRRASPHPLPLAVWSSLTALLLVSMHYGAPLIYGPNVLVILLWGLADGLEGPRSRRSSTSGLTQSARHEIGRADGGPPRPTTRSRMPAI